MRRRMVTEVHLDHDPIEGADPRHVAIVHEGSDTPLGPETIGSDADRQPLNLHAVIVHALRIPRNSRLLRGTARDVCRGVEAGLAAIQILGHLSTLMAARDCPVTKQSSKPRIRIVCAAGIQSIIIDVSFLM